MKVFWCKSVSANMSLFFAQPAQREIERENNNSSPPPSLLSFYILSLINYYYLTACGHLFPYMLSLLASAYCSPYE